MHACISLEIQHQVFSSCQNQHESSCYSQGIQAYSWHWVFLLFCCQIRLAFKLRWHIMQYSYLFIVSTISVWVYSEQLWLKMLKRRFIPLLSTAMYTWHPSGMLRISLGCISTDLGNKWHQESGCHFFFFASGWICYTLPPILVRFQLIQPEFPESSGIRFLASYHDVHSHEVVGAFLCWGLRPQQYVGSTATAGIALLSIYWAVSIEMKSWELLDCLWSRPPTMVGYPLPRETGSPLDSKLPCSP